MKTLGVPRERMAVNSTCNRYIVGSAMAHTPMYALVSSPHHV